jgi:hypothetical protein
MQGQVPVFIPPGIPPDTGFPFCRLLRLSMLQWRYSNSPPHGDPIPFNQNQVKVTLRLTVSQSVSQYVLMSNPLWNFLLINSKSYYDRRSVGQSVLVSGTHLGPATKIPLLSLLIFWQLLVCWCGAPSLTRSWVCSFQFLLSIASAVLLSSKFHGTHKHILLSLFSRLPQPRGPGSCIYFPHEQGSSGHWVLSELK